MTEQWDELTDVIVLGSGFAGLAAAIEARNHGTSVLVLEKMAAPGGNSIISDGGIAAAGTKFQEKFGVSDSPDLMYRDMLTAGLHLNHPALVREVTNRSNEVLEWTMYDLGVEYMDRLDIFGGHSVPRCLTPVGVSGAAIIKQQLARLEDLGVTVRTKTYFVSFVTDAVGDPSGVLVRENYSPKDPESGPLKRIGCKKGIVLATGGFGSDVPFRLAQDPRLTGDIATTNKPFATAEALKEALKLRAMPVHLSHIQLGPWGAPEEIGYAEGARFSDYIGFPYGVIIDPATGKRIVNELADRKIISDVLLDTGHPCVSIADQKAVETTGWSLDAALKKGVVKRFENLAALAAHYDIDPEALMQTIETFNGYVTAGKDGEFGKQIMPDAARISHPPYYSAHTWPKVHHTMGGVQIDAKARVLDIEGNPIPRLYAAGEVTGGIHGACRLGSCAVTECLVFGRIAGVSAAGEPGSTTP